VQSRQFDELQHILFAKMRLLMHFIQLESELQLIQFIIEQQYKLLESK
jgi:hypothetical protein